MTSSVTLLPGYTEKYLLLAAITVQLERYGVYNEEGGNTNNARIFESPGIKEHASGALELFSSEHSADGADKFNSLMKSATKTPDWEGVREQYPFPYKDVYSIKLLLANYLTSFIQEFKLFASNIEIELGKNFLDVNLLKSLAVALKNVLTPRGDDLLQESSDIRTLCNMIENRFLLKDIEISEPTQLVESYCEVLMHRVSLMIAPPIGDELAYGGVLGRSLENNEINNLLDTSYGVEEYKQFDFPARYVIPSACFHFSEKMDSQQILWKFLASNVNFYKEINVGVHQQLYKSAFQRLWDNFVEDKRCPQWIKDKNSELRDQIYAQPTLVLSLFDGLSARIDKCDKTNENSFKNLLITFVEETLLVLTKNSHVAFDQKILADKLSNLIDLYLKEKTFHAKLCVVIIQCAHGILKNMALNDLANISKIRDSYKDSGVLENILESVHGRMMSVINSSDASEHERRAVSEALLGLKGAVPKDYFAPLMSLEKSKRSGSPTSVAGFSSFLQSFAFFGTPPSSPASSPSVFSPKKI